MRVAFGILTTGATKTMRTLTFFVIFITIVTTTAFYIYRDTTEPPRFSSIDFEGLDNETIIQKIADATVAGGAPGAIIHVRQKGLTHTVSSGIANKVTQQAMPTNIPLRIASVSKIYTAAVIHSLISDGLFSLDTPITQLLPSDILSDIDNADQATVRQLLHHTSGIPDYYDLRSYLSVDWREPITLEAMLPIMRRREATSKVGEEYSYSNSGYLLLGMIAEITSNQTLDTLIKERITSKLQLQDTFYNTFQVVNNDIHGYGTYFRPWKDTHEYWEHSGPDSGIQATASDLSAFLAALLMKDGRLADIGDNLLNDMFEIDARSRQGLGIETIISSSTGEEFFGHSGDAFGYQTVAYAFPNRDIVVVAHLNCDCASLTMSMLRNLFHAIETIDENG